MNIVKIRKLKVIEFYVEAIYTLERKSSCEECTEKLKSDMKKQSKSAF